MAEEKKVEAPGTQTTQAPAQSQAAGEKKEGEQQAGAPAGLHSFTKEQLQEFYKKSPEMFVEAGIVEKKQEKKEEKPAQETKPADKKGESAAPTPKVAKYADKEIKLPEDVPLNEQAVGTYFDHWKEVGFSPEQVQREVDFMADRARAEKKAIEEKARKAETPLERAKREDAENVAALKADPEFGKDFDKNMEIARRAAAKYFTKDVLARMLTSDPLLIKQAWNLGKLDKEDRTAEGGQARTGEEGEQAKKEQEAKDPRGPSQLRKRYSNSPGMNFGDQK